MIKYLFSKLIQKIQLPCIRGSSVSKKAAVCRGAQVDYCTVGDYSYIGPNVRIAYTEVGKYCSIAPNCMIGQGKHPTDWISTSPVFYGNKNLFNFNLGDEQFEEFDKTRIGNDVWIGAGAMIKGGVTIADGAIIGMGAIVTKDVGPYEIWAGSPARLIRKRFDDETAERLQQIKWWDMSEQQLAEYKAEFSNPQKFIEKAANK